ncbi:hypothetical protein K2173_024757 [Erythroxylum novogranatense]|uniref:Exostosin GT47 domain-containing protein n=1 Tax=Erythroxylum novogranatense TaxID=1862640 RepID=A0AAV8SWC4_9ROSI|nr:hypothetical protein K2173_024757 [Erythroxylum novogranatense]
MEKPIITNHRKLFWFILLLPLSLLFLYGSHQYFSSLNGRNTHFSFLCTSLAGVLKPCSLGVAQKSRNQSDEHSESCSGRYIYVHDLPSQFNDDLLRNCSWLLRPWYDMCPYLTNSGLGRQVENSEGVLSENSWFQTNQFVLEIIFRNRMKKYKCLTNDSSSASAVFVPFFAGLDVGRFLWTHNASTRDALGLNLTRWVRERPEWKKLWGRDHFFVTGRIASDFRRPADNDWGWGSKLLNLPESMNMTVLSIESTNPWSKNEFAVPYPTHFHPSSEDEVHQWQMKMRNQKRHYLFSFSGAPRPFRNDSIRNEIIEQCLASGNLCKLLDCSSPGNNCENPVEVVKVFRDSVFCLQPPGDSPTRRSTFESILSGCIPVFFDPGSAYTQYIWHLPKNYTEYSVFIPRDLVKEGKVRINETLLQVSENDILAKREDVLRLIPKVIYADFRSKSEILEDAFDIAVKRVLERVETLRRQINNGNDLILN